MLKKIPFGRILFKYTEKTALQFCPFAVQSEGQLELYGQKKDSFFSQARSTRSQFRIFDDF